MYLLKRIPCQDDINLIGLFVNNFKIESEMFLNILRKAHEVIIICND